MSCGYDWKLGLNNLRKEKSSKFEKSNYFQIWEFP